MLNLNCIICAEIFIHSDNVFITTCGHMFHKKCLDQWLDRSKTCPQCRQKCLDRNIFRVFFNQSNVDLEQSNVGCLQERLDNTMLQLRLKETELNKSLEEIRKLGSCQKKNVKTIAGLEKKLEANNFLVHSYAEQLKLLREENKTLQVMCADNERLKADFEIMKSASSVLVASIAESEKILETETDVKKLTAWVSTLKRELEQCKNKKNYIQEQLRKTRDEFRKQTDAKKILENRLKELNSELYKLTPKTFEIGKEDDQHKTQQSNPINDIHTIIHEHEKSIEYKQTDSPFLNIKSCSIGLKPLIQPRRLKVILPAKSNISPKKFEQYSISKKPRLDGALLFASKSAPIGFENRDRTGVKYVTESPEKCDMPTVPKTSLNNRLKSGKLRNFAINKRENREML